MQEYEDHCCQGHGVLVLQLPAHRGGDMAEGLATDGGAHGGKDLEMESCCRQRWW
jgi:hypothetical protein